MPVNNTGPSSSLIDGQILAQTLRLQSANSNSEKNQILYNLIKLKIKNNKNYKIYIDIKQFIKFYILSSEENDFGYDTIDINKITSLINILDINQRLSLYKYTLYQLKTTGQNELIEDIEENIHSTSIQIEKYKFIKKANIFSGIKAILLQSTKNIKWITITLLSMIITMAAILYPVSKPLFHLFDYQMTRFSSFVLLDHFINILLILLSLDDRVKIYPHNSFGALLLFISKGAYILFIAGIVLKQLDKKLEL